MLPPDEAAVADPDLLLDRVDALILAGGADIDPASYGAEPHAETKGTWPDRDRFEIALARRAIERDMPVLGICRGMQLLNVALGGTLDQHLPESTGSERAPRGRRHLRRAPGAAGAGDARLRRGRDSRASSSGRTTTRGVDEVGEGLRVSGWSVDDDLVEAIELPDKRFALGVVWHPEEDPDSKVIAALVEAARGDARELFLMPVGPAKGTARRERDRGDRAGDRAGDGERAAGRGGGGRRGGRGGEGGVPGLAGGDAGGPGGAAARDSPTRRRPSSRSLATLEARNAGKPIGDARGEIGMVVETFRYYAGAPERLLGQTIPVAGGVDMTFREPLGVVGLIVPWNFPLTIAAWKVAPALAAGNCVVLKPAELTPLTALELERIGREAGLPEGVLNVVAGPGSGLRPAAGRASRRRQGRLHRLDRGRPRDRGRGGGDDQAGDARARRQVGQRRLRRRRPGGGRSGGARRGLRQRRPGLLRALADPGRALCPRRLPRGAGAARSRRSRSATRSTRRPRWAR